MKNNIILSVFGLLLWINSFSQKIEMKVNFGVVKCKFLNETKDTVFLFNPIIWTIGKHIVKNREIYQNDTVKLFISNNLEHSLDIQFDQFLIKKRSNNVIKIPPSQYLAFKFKLRNVKKAKYLLMYYNFCKNLDEINRESIFYLKLR